MNIDDFQASDLTFDVCSVKSKSGELQPLTFRQDLQMREAVASSIYNSLFGKAFEVHTCTCLCSLIQYSIYDNGAESQSWTGQNISRKESELKEQLGSNLASKCLQQIDRYLNDELVHLTEKTVGFGDEDFDKATYNYLSFVSEARLYTRGLPSLLALVTRETESVDKSFGDGFYVPFSIRSLLFWEQKHGFIEESCTLNEIMARILDGALPLIPNIPWNQFVNVDYNKQIRNLYKCSNGLSDFMDSVENEVRAEAKLAVGVTTDEEFYDGGYADDAYYARDIKAWNEFSDKLLAKFKESLADNQHLQSSYDNLMSRASTHFKLLLPKSTPNLITQEQGFAMMMAPDGRCPKCTHPLYTRKVGLSTGKAAIGGLLAGFTGALVGATMGKKEYYCPNCGYVR